MKRKRKSKKEREKERETEKEKKKRRRERKREELRTARGVDWATSVVRSKRSGTSSHMGVGPREPPASQLLL